MTDELPEVKADAPDQEKSRHEPIKKAQPRKTSGKAPAPVITRSLPAISGHVIYIGPSLPDGKLNRYTVFRSGLPAHVQKLVDEVKALRTLLVPVVDLAEVSARLQQPESLERAKFNEVRKHFSKGVK